MVNACGRETITDDGMAPPRRRRRLRHSGRNQRCFARRNSLMTACYAMIRTDVAAARDVKERGREGGVGEIWAAAAADGMRRKR